MPVGISWLPITRALQPIRTSQLIIHVKNPKSGCRGVFSQAKAWQQSNKLHRWWFTNKAFKKGDDTDSFMTKYQLQSSRRVNYLTAELRSPCIPPVTTVPRGDQITVHSTSQHSTTLWSDHRVFNQSPQYHVVIRSPCIPPVSTVPHCGQIIVYSTSHHSTTW